MLMGEDEIAMNKGEMTRQRIIEESAPIFNQRGYAGCSMQDVMEATGLEKGGIYRHFESKGGVNGSGGVSVCVGTGGKNAGGRD